MSQAKEKELITNQTTMTKKSLYLHRSSASTDMRMTSDIVIRANKRTMASAGQYRSAKSGRFVDSDGSIEVSVRYSGNRYTQRITPQQLSSSFGKAIASHVKKI
ncbi:hypothetical protein [uncultured Muribaculum sp.]|uniref:hypothetical protein n=1 Tax=uncultured Muribaculum sp. TaxID=1918613 RepID=UPI0027304114|nr:hypothetical protein [uncultured Muribaculum sp.]